MKTIKIVVLLAIISLNCFGQTEKGKLHIGAFSNFNFTYTSYDKEKSGHADFFIAPRIGYLFVENFSGGLEGALLLSGSSTTYVISPFLKYYFLKGKSKPFINTQYGLGVKNDDYPSLDAFGAPINTENHTRISSFTIGGGFAYFINETVSLEFNANYLNKKYTTKNNQNYKNSTKANSYQLLIGFGIFL